MNSNKWTFEQWQKWNSWVAQNRSLDEQKRLYNDYLNRKPQADERDPYAEAEELYRAEHKYGA